VEKKNIIEKRVEEESGEKEEKKRERIGKRSPRFALIFVATPLMASVGSGERDYSRTRLERKRENAADRRELAQQVATSSHGPHLDWDKSCI